ncbi:MAG: DUF1801 domain-containing protein [Pseudomonadota bacterium]
MVERKGPAPSPSVDDFLHAVAHDRRREESFILKDMMERVTTSAPILWNSSIIGFDQYHYKYDSGREGDFLMLGFSPRKANFSLYFMPGYGTYDQFIQKLGKVKMGKACVYINKLSDIDMNALEDLTKACIDHMREKYPSQAKV